MHLEGDKQWEQPQRARAKRESPRPRPQVLLLMCPCYPSRMFCAFTSIKCFRQWNPSACGWRPWLTPWPSHPQPSLSLLPPHLHPLTPTPTLLPTLESRADTHTQATLGFSLSTCQHYHTVFEFFFHLGFLRFFSSFLPSFLLSLRPFF